MRIGSRLEFRDLSAKLFTVDSTVDYPKAPNSSCVSEEPRSSIVNPAVVFFPHGFRA